MKMKDIRWKRRTKTQEQRMATPGFELRSFGHPTHALNSWPILAIGIEGCQGGVEWDGGYGGVNKKEEGRRKKEAERRKKEAEKRETEGRRKKEEEGKSKKEEERRKKEE